MQAVRDALAGWQQSLFDDIEAYWLENPPPSQLTRQEAPRRRNTPEQPKPKRYQVGSIAERISNPKRANPYTCYFFCWNEKDETGKWRGRKIYVPQSQMNEIYIMVDRKCPYWETLRAIRKSPKPHHTDTPKL